jgi:hypothetical protein
MLSEERREGFPVALVQDVLFLSPHHILATTTTTSTAASTTTIPSIITSRYFDHDNAVTTISGTSLLWFVVVGRTPFTATHDTTKAHDGKIGNQDDIKNTVLLCSERHAGF